MKKEGKKSNTEFIIPTICITLAVAIIVGCIFFSDEIFGLFIK